MWVTLYNINVSKQDCCGNKTNNTTKGDQRMKSLPLLTAEDWKAFYIFTDTCPHYKAVRGGGMCVIDGINGYCHPFGCPERNGRPH